MTIQPKFKANPNKLLPNPIFGKIFTQNNRLTEQKTQGIISTQSQKTIVSRGKLNNLILANISTPFNYRAFFVCSTRTPQRMPETLRGSEYLSMVGRGGQSLVIGYFPRLVVFHPVTFYRQTVEKFAVVPKYLILELSTMLYLFKAVSRLDLRNTKKPFSSFPCYTLRIYADSLEQAKAKVCPFYAVLAINGGNA